jgi:hypothetical protein
MSFSRRYGYGVPCLHMFGWMRAAAFKKLVEDGRKFRLKEKDPSSAPSKKVGQSNGAGGGGGGASLLGVVRRKRKAATAAVGLGADTVEAVGDLMPHRLAAVRGGKKSRQQVVVAAPSALNLEQLQQQQQQRDGEEEEGEEEEEEEEEGEEYEVNVVEVDGSDVGGLGGEGGS